MVFSKLVFILLLFYCQSYILYIFCIIYLFFRNKKLSSALENFLTSCFLPGTKTMTFCVSGTALAFEYLSERVFFTALCSFFFRKRKH